MKESKFENNNIFNPFRIIHLNNCQLSKYFFYPLKFEAYSNIIGSREKAVFENFEIKNNNELLEDFSKCGKQLINNKENEVNLFPYIKKFKYRDQNGNEINNLDEYIEIQDISKPKYFTNANVKENINEIAPIIIPFFKKYGFPCAPVEVENDEKHSYATFIQFHDIEKFVHQLIIFHLIYNFNSIYNLIYNNKLNSYFDKIKDLSDIEKEDFDDEMTAYYTNILKPNINKINEILKVLFKTSEEKIELNLENSTGDIILKKYKPKNFAEDLEELYKKYIKLVNFYSYQFLEDNTYKIYTDINVEKNCLFYSSENLFCLVWHTFINSLLMHKSNDKIHYCEICNRILIQTGTKKPTRCPQHINIGKQAKTDNKKKRISQEIINLSKIHKIDDETINKYVKNAEKRLNKTSLFRKVSVNTLEMSLNRVKEYINNKLT